MLPKTHGSALFTRGETQAIVVATLGTVRDAALIDALEGSYKDPFMLHYNFPPFSVGEAGFMGGPKRREIGHGRLARRSVDCRSVLPDMPKSFPYTHACGFRDHRIVMVRAPWPASAARRLP